MNVCSFLGGKTTEHESFSAQRNAGQGAKHLKKKVSFNFLILEKNFFEIYIKFACWWWSFWCSAQRIQIVLCFGRCNSQLRRSRAGFHCNAMFIYVILQSGGKTKAPCFCGKKMPPVCSWRTVTMVLPDHKVAITKQFKHC